MNIFLTRFLIVAGSISIAVGSFCGGTIQQKMLACLYFVANIIIFIFTG